MVTRYAHLPSPLGDLLLTAEAGRITGLTFPGHRGRPTIGTDWIHDPAPFAVAREQLEAYLDGDRQAFDLPLVLGGTDRQREVWSALCAIPFGTTVTYGQLARQLGRPSAARAVAMAVARNPVSIVVPCHRVVGAGGRLTGYAGGLDRKRWLLALEGVVLG